MDFTELAKTRCSIRKFLPDPVPEEDLLKILETAGMAPSWKNTQTWRFIAVTDPAKIEALVTIPWMEKSTNRWAKYAPMLLVACAVPGESGVYNGIDYKYVDMGIAFDHLTLKAWEMGYGTCWLGVYDEETVQRELGIPREVKVVAMTPLGRPLPDYQPREKKRKPVEEILKRDCW